MYSLSLREGIFRDELLASSELLAKRPKVKLGCGSIERAPFHFRLHSWKLHAGKLSRKTGLPHLLKHFSHLRILAQQIIDFLHAGSGAASDPFATASVHHFVVQTLVSCH